MSRIEELLNVFVESYIETALWASTDEDGEPLNKRFNAGHFTDRSWLAIVSQCADFLTIPTVRDCMMQEPWGESEYKQAGHDFFLSRNGHGAGFRDGQWGKFGTDLARAAIGQGESTVFASECGTFCYV